MGPPETLLEIIRGEDPAATQIVGDDQCEWIRSRFGIVGRIVVSERCDQETLRSVLNRRIAHAHAVLDQLPDQTLSFEDLWNLTLFIMVPWSKEEVQTEKPVADRLLGYARDSSGSRKVLLWRGTGPRDHLGPLGRGPESWMPSRGEPLQDAIDSVARCEEEKQALGVLFKRRIPEEDIERLVRVLSRESPDDQ
jgi:hypothetical protein